jgi:hypothetical protein
VPVAEIPVHNNRLPQSATWNTILVRNDVLFTNEHGEEKRGTQKRSEKALQKLAPALQRVLLPGETVFYIARALSPLTILEQLTAAWWTRLLAASAVVLTNKRLLFFPVKSDGSWKESVRSMQWGDLEEVKAKGLLIRNVTFKSKNGTKTTYTHFRRGDANKIVAIATALLPASSGEMTATHGFVQLCPDCRNALIAGQYFCAGCGLTFKSEQTMVKRSIFLPGGGYFYTGHPWIAILPAIVEGILLLELVLFLIAGLASPQAGPKLIAAVMILGIFWALETSVTILHCRRYIREYIPEKRDPSRAPQPVTVKANV